MLNQWGLVNYAWNYEAVHSLLCSIPGWSALQAGMNVNLVDHVCKHLFYLKLRSPRATMGKPSWAQIAWLFDMVATSWSRGYSSFSCHPPCYIHFLEYMGKMINLLSNNKNIYVVHTFAKCHSSKDFNFSCSQIWNIGLYVTHSHKTHGKLPEPILRFRPIKMSYVNIVNKGIFKRKRAWNFISIFNICWSNASPFSITYPWSGVIKGDSIEKPWICTELIFQVGVIFSAMKLQYLLSFWSKAQL